MVAAVGRRIVLILAVIVLLLPGCGDDDTTATDDVTTTEWVPDYAAAAAWTSGAFANSDGEPIPTAFPQTADEIRDRPDLRGLCDIGALALEERGWGRIDPTTGEPWPNSLMKDGTREGWFGAREVFMSPTEGYESRPQPGVDASMAAPGPFIYFLCGPERFTELTEALFGAPWGEAAEEYPFLAEFLTNPGQ